MTTRTSIQQGDLDITRWGSLLPVACRRPPCAAGPYPPIQSAIRWGGQIYTAGQQAHSGGCPSHGWPGSASLPSAHCGRERGRGNRPNRWLRTRRQDGLVIVLSPRWRGLGLTHQVAVPVQISSRLSTSYQLNMRYLTLLSSRATYSQTIPSLVEDGKRSKKQPATQWLQHTH